MHLLDTYNIFTKFNWSSAQNWIWLIQSRSIAKKAEHNKTQTNLFELNLSLVPL